MFVALFVMLLISNAKSIVNFKQYRNIKLLKFTFFKDFVLKFKCINLNNTFLTFRDLWEIIKIVY